MQSMSVLETAGSAMHRRRTPEPAGGRLEVADDDGCCSAVAALVGTADVVSAVGDAVGVRDDGDAGPLVPQAAMTRTTNPTTAGLV